MSYNNADFRDNRAAEMFLEMVERFDAELTEAKTTIERLEEEVSDLKSQLGEAEGKVEQLQATLDSIPST